jgi:hypothetical protein
MRTIFLKCENCGESFERAEKEARRCKKRGFAVACGRTCGAILRNKKHSKGNVSNLNCSNRQDEFSSFRYYINKAHSAERVKNYGKTNLTVEYLKALWEKQDGICPYTGYTMELPKNTQDHNIKGSPKKASLDRIDSSLGYAQGNVEFVCLSVNYAKNGFSHEQMLDFFKNIPREFPTPLTV